MSNSKNEMRTKEPLTLNRTKLPNGCLVLTTLLAGSLYETEVLAHGVEIWIARTTDAVEALRNHIEAINAFV
jgi:hypothetical protein